MNTYKLKQLLIIVSIVMLGLSDGVSARKNRYPCPTFNLKRHEFGIGVSTTFFDSNRKFNSHKLNDYVGMQGISEYCNLSTNESSFFSLFFDYQYRFNDNWSLEARLKYKHRKTELRFNFIEEVGVGANMCTHGAYLNFRDIVVPITCNYRWVTRTGSSIEFIAGGGFGTLGIGGVHNLSFGYNDVENTCGEYGLYYNKFFDVFGTIGIQFEIPYGLFTLKPFITYTYSAYPNSEFKILYKDINNKVTKEYSSEPLRTKDLEFGIILQL